MALDPAIVWEVRTAGSDNSGGGFKAGASGTDRSQQDAAQATLTAASTVHTTTTQVNVAVGDFTVSAADVGNVLQITGGTATAGFYEITAVDVPNNRWTVDRSAGTAGQTVVGAMGGALATPAKAEAASVDGNDVWLKMGTYTTTAEINLTKGGIAGGPRRWRGYETTRGDRAGRPTIRATAAIGTQFMVKVASTVPRGLVIDNIIFDANSQATTRCLEVNKDGLTLVNRCDFLNGTFGGARMFNNNAFVNCFADNCSGGAAIYTDGGGLALGCRVKGSATGFQAFSGGAAHAFCIAETCSTVGFDTNTSISNVRWVNCTAYNCAKGYVVNTGVTNALAANCLAYTCSTEGFGGTTANQDAVFLVNCAGGNNGINSIFTSEVGLDLGFVTLTADPFVNAAGGNFSLNSTAGGGAALRAAGFPGVFVGSNTTGYLDIGAAQHQDSAGGGSFGGVFGDGQQYLE